MSECELREPGGTTSTAWLYGLLHAAVDLATVTVVMLESSLGRVGFDEWLRLLYLYNALAFGLQFPLGLACDRLRAEKTAAAAGIALALIAVLLAPRFLYAAIVLAGLGNALFHIGAGGTVLRGSAGRAADPGVFVGPGALGLFLGLWLGRAGGQVHGLLAVMLVAGLMLVVVHRPSNSKSVIRPPSPALLLAATLVAGSIALRSTLGFALTDLWRAWPNWGVVLTLAAVTGKMLGGFIADRIGWSTVAAAVLLGFACLSPAMDTSGASAVSAMVLLQIVMPIALAALYRQFPGRPATMFGLASGVLLLGAVPSLAEHAVLTTPGLLAAVALASAVLLVVGIAFANDRERRVRERG